jgi:hypothetical protein
MLIRLHMDWGLMHKYLRAGFIRVIREAEGQVNQIPKSDLLKGYRALSGDKIYLLKESSRGLPLGGSQSLRITEYSPVR